MYFSKTDPRSQRLKPACDNPIDVHIADHSLHPVPSRHHQSRDHLPTPPYFSTNHNLSPSLQFPIPLIPRHLSPGIHLTCPSPIPLYKPTTIPSHLPSHTFLPRPQLALKTELGQLRLRLISHCTKGVAEPGFSTSIRSQEDRGGGADTFWETLMTMMGFHCVGWERAGVRKDVQGGVLGGRVEAQGTIGGLGN